MKKNLLKMLEMIAEQRVVNEKRFGKPTVVKMSPKMMEYLELEDDEPLLGCEIIQDEKMAFGVVETLIVTDFIEVEVHE